MNIKDYYMKVDVRFLGYYGKYKDFGNWYLDDHFKITPKLFYFNDNNIAKNYITEGQYEDGELIYFENLYND